MQENPEAEQHGTGERRCSFCGSAASESARYCPACGRALDHAPPDVDIAGWVQTGWNAFVKNIGPAIAIPLVVLVPVIALAIVGYFGFFGMAIAAQEFGGTRGGMIALGVMGAVFGLMGLFFVFLMPALQAGIYACFLQGVRSGEVTAARLGDGFRNWWACTWVSWVLGAATVACVPFMLVIVGIPVFFGIKSLLWLSLLRIVDKRQGGMEALDFAWNAMRGRLWMMLLFTFLMLVLTMAGNAAMYIGVLVTTPIAVASLAAAYSDLSTRRPGGTS